MLVLIARYGSFTPLWSTHLVRRARAYLAEVAWTHSRSRSRWLKAIRSVSRGPPATHESGHFYFAQTGNHICMRGRRAYGLRKNGVEIGNSD